MKKITKLLIVGATALIALFSIAIPASAQVSGSLWKIVSGSLHPISSTWSLTVDQLGGHGTNCVQVDNNGLFAVSGSGCGGSGSAFPFTPQTWGNSTSTTIGFSQGIITNASTTFAQLTTGNVYDQNGLILAFATTSSSQQSQAVWRDANQNAFAQNFVSAGTSFPTNGGTVTLTAASPRNWIFTGTKTQTMQLPSGTTLSVGATYTANDNSTGTTTVVDNGSNVIAIVPPGGKSEFVISDVSTTNGSWDAHALLGHGNVSGTNGLGIGTTSPYANLSLMIGDDFISHPIGTAFAIGSSTAGLATSTLFSISSTGQITSAATATTSLAWDINVPTGHCFQVNGTCISTGSGTVTSIVAGTGLLGGTITTSGTITNTLATSSAITISHLPYWTSTGSNGTALLGDVATTTFSITGPFNVPTGFGALVGGSGSVGYYGLATTSQPASSNLLVSNGAAGVYGVATSTLSASSPLTGSFTQIGSGGSLGCTTASLTQAGCISAASFDTFNNKVGTSSSETGGQVAVWGTTSGTPANLYSVATSTLSVGAAGLSGLTVGGTLGSFVGGSSPTLAVATSSLYTGTTGQIPWFSGTNTLIGTSSITIGSGNSFVGISSTTPSNLFSVGQAAAGFFITTAGKIWARDAVNAFEGILSPTKTFVLSQATTTTWTATTSNPYVIQGEWTTTFAGTIKDVRCTATSTQSFLGVAPFVNTTATTPSYFVASTTVGVEKFTSGNTFNVGDIIGMYVGTSTATTNNVGVTCSFEAVQTS